MIPYLPYCCLPQQQRWDGWRNRLEGRRLYNMQLPKPELPLSPPTGQVTHHSWWSSCWHPRCPENLQPSSTLHLWVERMGTVHDFTKRKRHPRNQRFFMCSEETHSACCCLMTHSLAQGPFLLFLCHFWTHFFLPLSLTSTFFTFSNFFFILNF